MKKLGVLVNPVAGMGGRVGLKGSDGRDIQRRAVELGAVRESPRRAVEALKILSKAEGQIEVVTYPREMGEDEAMECGWSPKVIGSITSGHTTPDDTRTAAREMENLGVDLILFAGGDGTARDVHQAVGLRVPGLGIPAGVKIHSGVYAVSPRHAGEVALKFLQGKLATRDAEVMDIDEEAFRQGLVTARLFGYLQTPEERRAVQRVKTGGIRSEKEALQGIAAAVVSEMEEDCLYIIGPGTTTRVVMEELGLENTLLGIDVVLDKRLVANDANEGRLLEILGGRKAKIVVSVIGGQGYILGRGNQQLSPRVVRKVGKENLIVVATTEKLASLSGRPLLVDTGDPELDRELAGFIRVTIGYKNDSMYRVGN